MLRTHAGVFLGVLLLGTPQVLPSQSLAPQLTAWSPALRTQSLVRIATVPQDTATSETHSHTLTGLLIGGTVGLAATGVFLSLFCSDSDTKCGADEVARAVAIIAVPPAVVGAVIGSLVRTKR